MKNLEDWNNKCENEIENKENELERLKKVNTKENLEFEDLNLKFASYKAVVVEDTYEKERIKQEQQAHELQINASIQLQAWWRGTMVRKGFGEYRKKKGGKGGKKGKGKKGKGKKK